MGIWGRDYEVHPDPDSQNIILKLEIWSVTAEWIQHLYICSPGPLHFLPLNVCEGTSHNLHHSFAYTVAHFEVNPIGLTMGDSPKSGLRTPQNKCSNSLSHFCKSWKKHQLMPTGNLEIVPPVAYFTHIISGSVWSCSAISAAVEN